LQVLTQKIDLLHYLIASPDSEKCFFTLINSGVHGVIDLAGATLRKPNKQVTGILHMFVVWRQTRRVLEFLNKVNGSCFHVDF
jgi:hypothetical protein